VKQPMEITFDVGDLTLAGAMAAAGRLAILPDADTYKFDFGRSDWFEPFGMLYFGLKLRQARAQRKSARFQATNYVGASHAYAAHMGFFRMFGLKHGNQPGEAPGSSQYVPITSLDVGSLRAEAVELRQDVQTVIEGKSKELSTMLTREGGTDLHSTLSYSLREILRNVVEHSQSDQLWFAAQHWPSKKKVELVVADEGIGIRKSLSRNPHLTISDDSAAIDLALQPGVSGVAFRGARQRRQGEWANSGYGLFMTSRLCASGGSFILCSGEGALLLEQEQETRTDLEFNGTILRLEIYVPKVKELRLRLNELRDEGAKLAAASQHRANRSPSLSSRGLKSNT
jgi:hypothetical protein